ncbi:hypothetical protein OHT93_23375 [Streptomyces sp. NBC_00191]
MFSTRAHRLRSLVRLFGTFTITVHAMDRYEWKEAFKASGSSTVLTNDPR